MSLTFSKESMDAIFIGIKCVEIWKSEKKNCFKKFFSKKTVFFFLFAIFTKENSFLGLLTITIRKSDVQNIGYGSSEIFFDQIHCTVNLWTLVTKSVRSGANGLMSTISPILIFYLILFHFDRRCKAAGIHATIFSKMIGLFEALVSIFQ